MKQCKCFRINYDARFIRWLHVLWWAFKTKSVSYGSIYGPPWMVNGLLIGKSSRQAVNISGNKSGTVKIFFVKTCVDVNR